MCDELIKNKEKYFADSLTYEGSSVSKCSLSVETLSRLTHLEARCPLKGSKPIWNMYIKRKRKNIINCARLKKGGL